MILYKYCSLETALRIIESSKIKLNIPSYFNDPYDSLCNITQIIADKKDFNTLYESIMQKTNHKFVLDEASLNKAYNDSSIFYVKDMFSITCFSEVCDEILMWSHYAARHNGVCLAFDFNSDICKKIKKCQYIYPTKGFSVTNLEDATVIKARNWHYEKEWRYIEKREAPFAQEQLRMMNSRVKAIHANKNLNEWHALVQRERQQIKNNYIHYLNIAPVAVYLGCRYANLPLAGRENIILNYKVPVLQPNGEVIDGLHLVTEYKHATLLKLCKERKMNVHQMNMQHDKFGLVANMNVDIDKLINQIENTKYCTSKNIDLFNF